MRGFVQPLHMVEPQYVEAGNDVVFLSTSPIYHPNLLLLNNKLIYWAVTFSWQANCDVSFEIFVILRKKVLLKKEPINEAPL
jgi:hypothetical protein